ncbi:hypothetical protein CVT25_014871 [Psilocybe cyanescens]|uniref:Beta-lactamase-related domain-containing protein n=1 Tax=Psilocybe cyanescens TaxID=93625 RepID=A0A409XTB4_PSICY|nr:hypothetical protein CVT25_014871 [Psilocybe cyanescens]
MAVLTKIGKESLDNLVAEISQNQKIPGFLFGATSVDEEIYLKPSGYNIVNDPKSGLIKEDSMFWLCGQSKMVVHLAALQLVERGKITLECPVSDYIPEFANLVVLDDQMADVPTYKPAKTIMRLKHILNFTSGLFYPMKGFRLDQQPEAYATPYNKDNPISQFLSIIKAIAHGWSSDIVGFLVEKVTGQSLENYLQDNIFKPLDIKASFYLTPDIKERLVDLTFRRGNNLEAWSDQSRIIERDPLKLACHMGGAGLYSSLKDFLTLLRHILKIMAGTASNSIISPGTVESIFEPALNDQSTKPLDRFLSMDPFTPTSGTQWTAGGFALSSSDLPGRRKKGSGFWFGWAHTFFLIDPTTEVATVFGTQIMPAADQEVFKAVAELEKALYAGLAA